MAWPSKSCGLLALLIVENITFELKFAYDSRYLKATVENHGSFFSFIPLFPLFQGLWLLTLVREI